MIARPRFQWLMFRECGKSLCSNRFSLRLKGTVYKSCVKSAILYRSEVWHLEESKMLLLHSTERSTVRAIFGVQLNDRKRANVLTVLLGLDETVKHLAMPSSERRGSCIEKDIRV